MPLRKPTDDDHNAGQKIEPANHRFPPEAYKYEAELNPETVKLIQAKADEVLCQEEWVVIDGVDKR